MTQELSVSYFGRRGGGAHFTQAISKLQEEITVLVSSKNSLHKQCGGRTIPIQGIPSGIIQNLLIRKNEKNQLIDEIVTKMRSTSISLMQHPLDNDISKSALKKKNIISVIHDPKVHPGDFWPNYASIKKRIEYSNKIVTLSKYSRDTLYEIFSAESEVLPLLGPVIDRKLLQPQRIYDVAFFGRQKKYKGNDNFIRAITLLKKPISIVTNTLTTNQIRYLQRNSPHEIKFFPSWIEEESLIDLISYSQILVLPYTEASQSGWIPIARDLNTPVIATNVGGLSEQFVSGRDGILVNNSSPTSLRNAIQSGLSQPWIEICNMNQERDVWRKYLEYN